MEGIKYPIIKVQYLFEKKNMENGMRDKGLIKNPMKSSG